MSETVTVAIVAALGTVGAASVPVIAGLAKWVIAPRHELENEVNDLRQRIKTLEDEKSKRELANTIDSTIAKMLSDHLKNDDST